MAQLGATVLINISVVRGQTSSNSQAFSTTITDLISSSTPISTGVYNNLQTSWISLKGRVEIQSVGVATPIVGHHITGIAGSVATPTYTLGSPWIRPRAVTNFTLGPGDFTSAAELRTKLATEFQRARDLTDY